MAEKGIDINTRSRIQQVSVSSSGIEIQHQGKPINSTFHKEGNVYLVIDSSGSMAGDKLNQAKKGAIRFAKDALLKGYSTGLIQFDSSVTLLSEPSNEILMLERCLKMLTASGSTNMAEAISFAHQCLNEKPRNRAIVVVRWSPKFGQVVKSGFCSYN